MPANEPTLIHLDYEQPSAPVADTGAYELGAEIARGGMGVVYAARHRGLGRTVAMKIMRGAGFANAEELGRFRSETTAAARLDHPNIVPIYEVGEIFSQPFFTMKLIEGGSLGQRLKAGPLPVRDAARLIAKIARAVQHAHERGVLHRDLKPGNILLDPPTADASVGEPYLTDFGLAKFSDMDSALTCPGDLVGTPDYISPEQARGSRDLTTACDVWALGVLLYQLAGGVLPFTAPTAIAVLDRVKYDEPAPLDCDRDLATIVTRCLEKDPASRMPSASFLAEELERWLGGQPIRSRHVTATERAWKWMRRNPVRVAAAALVSLSVLVGSVTSFVLWQKAQSANFSLEATLGTLNRTNDDLAKSLRLSTASRLASESRLSASANSQLGLLLAVESVETTRQHDGTVLPESKGALYHALQHTGGSETTVSGGGLRPHESYVFPNPKGRWLITIGIVSERITAMLWDTTLPPGAPAAHRWTLVEKGAVIVRWDCMWLPDGHRFFSADFEGNVNVWDLATLLDEQPGGDATLERTFRFEKGADFPAPDTTPYVRIATDAKGQPIGLLLDCENDKTPFARFQPFTLDGASAPGRRIDFDANIAKSNRRVATCKTGRWFSFYDPYAESPPALLRLEPDGKSSALRFAPFDDSLVQCSAISDDGRWLAFGSHEGNVALYDLAAGDLAAIEKTRRIIFRRKDATMRIAFSPDARWLVACGLSPLAQLVALDGEPRLHREVRIPAGASRTCAFSPDSAWFATGSSDGIVRAWHVAATEVTPPVEFRGLTDSVSDIHFGTDMRSLHAVDSQSRARRWPFNGSHAGAIPLTSDGDTEPITDLAASPDGRWLAAAGTRGHLTAAVAPLSPIRIFDTRGGGLREHRIPGHRASTGTTFSTDGRWLATTGRDAFVKVWDFPKLAAALEAGTALPEPRILEPDQETRDNSPRSIAIHPRGTLYATCGDGFVFEWDLNKPTPEATHHHVHSIMYLLPDIAISPDGNWLAVARHGGDKKPREGWTQFGDMVLLFDCSKPGPPIPHLELKSPAFFIGKIAFSADSRHLITSARTGTAPAIWDLTAPEIAASLFSGPVLAIPPHSVALPFAEKNAPIPAWAALGGSDGALTIWNHTHGPLSTVRIETGSPIHTIATLPGGRIATGSLDGRLRIWETDLDRLLETARTSAGRKLSADERAKFAR